MTTGLNQEQAQAKVQISRHVPKWTQRFEVVANPSQVMARKPLRIETKQTYKELIEIEVLEGDWVELPRG